MRAVLIVLAMLVFAGQGCVLLPPSRHQDLSCQELNATLERLQGDVSTLESRIASQQEECDAYPVRYGDAANAGAAKAELDQIVEAHELCLAGVEEMKNEWEAAKEDVRLSQVEFEERNCSVELRSIEGSGSDL